MVFEIFVDVLHGSIFVTELLEKWVNFFQRPPQG
jgi:hypothetical protein